MVAVKRVMILSSCVVGLGLAITLAWVMQANAPALADQNVGTGVDTGEQEHSLLSNSVFITLTPGISASLIYTDPQGLPTRLDFPSDAVVETITITLLPELLTSPRPDFIDCGHTFALVASQDGRLLKDLFFYAPVTATIHYSDLDVQEAPDEDQLKVYWWVGWEWRDAALSCDPRTSYTYDEAHNTISIAICGTGQYGLFAKHSTYLPLILNRASQS